MNSGYEGKCDNNCHPVETIINEIIKCVQQFNDIPAKKMTECEKALLREYKVMAPGEVKRQIKRE